MKNFTTLLQVPNRCESIGTCSRKDIGDFSIPRRSFDIVNSLSSIACWIRLSWMLQIPYVKLVSPLITTQLYLSTCSSGHEQFGIGRIEFDCLDSSSMIMVACNQRQLIIHSRIGKDRVDIPDVQMSIVHSPSNHPFRFRRRDISPCQIIKPSVSALL
jgi:hypothetical protein